jgi:hypothetical protein
MGVKIEEWNYDVPEDGLIVEGVNFRALWVKVEDQAG